MDLKSTLTAELQSIQTRALALGQKAAAGNITDAEVAEVTSLADRAVAVKHQLNAIDRGEKGAAVM